MQWDVYVCHQGLLTHHSKVTSLDSTVGPNPMDKASLLRSVSLSSSSHQSDQIPFVSIRGGIQGVTRPSSLLFSSLQHLVHRRWLSS